jgi:hypothetical protein
VDEFGDMPSPLSLEVEVEAEVYAAFQHLTADNITCIELRLDISSALLFEVRLPKF